MADRVLTLRELNRATLARQMLLERADVSIPAAIERLVGLQAQQAIAPYIGLWTRLNDFKRDDLSRLIDEHTVIKATLMRSTLHLFTAKDYLLLRATLQPVLTSAFEAIAKGRGAEIDFYKVVAAAREFITQEPRSFAEISAMLTELAPDADVGSMRYAVRTHIPMVQVPTKTEWSYPGNPKFTLAEAWLGQSLPTEDNFKTLIFHYLAAFGPASVTDMQTWSGLSKLKDAVDALRPELVVYRDEGRREVFDLPDMPIPAEDMPAPERFLPEYDNLLLSHSKRTRVIADEYRSQVYLPGLRVRSTFLVDGFVRGGWKIDKTKSAATLTIEPFAPITKQNRDALAAEGEKLVRFAAADAKTFEVKFAE
ncbi:MAG: AlkZ family DNA glycosylase [Burkholderiales bacterium]|nr:AlkZ family DNA glycosylase [Anaerolineae bacterium]